MMADWRRTHWHMEAPIQSASNFIQFALMRLAQDVGVTVLLDGQGADELMGGYQYYFGLRQIDLLSAGRAADLERETAAFWWRLQRTAARFDKASRRFDARPGLPLETLWARRSAGAVAGAAPDRPGVPQSASASLFRRQLALGLLYDHLPNQLFTADRVGMAFGRELRFPFLDHDLVEWCIGLPDDLLARDGWLKRILRDATAGVLPRAIRWRVDKVGFAAPQDEWLRGRARTWAADLLFDGPILRHPLYDPQVMRALWAAHLAGANRSDELWKWLSASEWLRMSEERVWSNRIAPASAAREPERLAQ
jgi:asparagine synthase (glutamine-hydrolysing)